MVRLRQAVPLLTVRRAVPQLAAGSASLEDHRRAVLHLAVAFPAGLMVA